MTQKSSIAPPSQAPGTSAPPWWLGGLHLAALWTLAIAQPLFDLTARHSNFFVAHRLDRNDLILVAIALTLLGPGILLAMEALCRLLRPALGVAFHGIAIALLTAAVFVQIGKAVGLQSSWLLLPLAALAGLTTTIAYQRSGAVRSFFSILAFSVLVCPILFLSDDRVRRAAQRSAPLHSYPALPLPFPVVVVVFDELPIISLMKPDQTIDGERYPSFGALAETSTWFRRTTSVSYQTSYAVPAIVTGLIPRSLGNPLHSVHPDSLFTWLGQDNPVHVVESFTRLCPGQICGDEVIPDRRERLGSTADDLLILLGHVAAPPDLLRDLPAVGETWGHFRQDRNPDRPEGQTVARDNRRTIDGFLEALDGADGAGLHYLHLNLPHLPWKSLPSGKEYGPVGSNIRPRGVTSSGVWSDREWLTVQGYQRHLLQLSHADRVLGEIVAKLRERHLFDASLLVVLSDHGASFTPRMPRRRVDESSENLEEILEVPVFVKRPEQRDGAIIDKPGQTTDVMATLADVLGSELPWKSDGRSLFSSEENERSYFDVEEVAVRNFEVSATRRQRFVDRKSAIFGTGDLDQLFAIGSAVDLHGQTVARFSVATTDRTVRIRDPWALEEVDLESGFLPARILGTVDPPYEVDMPLAVALNGSILASTYTYEARRGTSEFSAILPEEAFRSGDNRVEVFEVQEEGARLARLAGRAATLPELIMNGDRLRGIRLSSGEFVPYTPFLGEGEFEVSEARIVGWAVNRLDLRWADAYLVTQGSEVLYVGTARGVRRRDIARRFKRPALERAGFQIPVPPTLLAQEGEMRVFAASQGQVFELDPVDSQRDQFVLSPGDQTVRFELRSDDGTGQTILAGADGRSIPVGPGNVAGAVDGIVPVAGDWLAVYGWAMEMPDKISPASIVAVVDGVARHAPAVFFHRREVARRFEIVGSNSLGFVVYLSRPPSGLSPEAVQVLAINRHKRAVPLPRKKDGPLRKGGSTVEPLPSEQ